MLKSKTSMRKLMLSGMVFVCGMAGTVQAATLASGPVYGGPSQGQVACTVVNVGTTPITFVKKELLGQFQAPLPLNFDDCKVSLNPRATCSFQAAAGNQATSCKVIIPDAQRAAIRGNMLALSPENDNLSQDALR